MYPHTLILSIYIHCTSLDCRTTDSHPLPSNKIFLSGMLYWFTFKAFEGKKTCLEGTGYLKSFVNGKSQYRCVRRKLIIPLHRYYYKYSLQCSPIGCTLCGILRNCLPVHCSRDLSTPPYTRVRHFVIRTADSPCPMGIGSSQAHWVEHSSYASI